MYRLSHNETITSLRNNAPQKIRITVDTANESFEITQSNIVQSSCSVDRYCCSGERIEIGSAIAAELKLTLKNTVITYNGQEYNLADITFEGAEMRPFCLVPSVNGSYEEIPLGIFTVDEPPRKLSTIAIKALDRMMRFDVAHDGTVGTSLLAVVQHCCNLAGVTLSSSAVTFLNSFAGVYTLPEAIADKEDLTCRQVLMWVGEMTAACAYADENGQLAFKQYPKSYTGAMTISEADRYSSDMQESDITISGITVTPTDSESEAVTIGAQGYEWNIEGNQLLVSPDEMASAPLGYSINEFFSYRPFKANTKSFPHLWPMDAIVFYKRNSEGKSIAYNSVITHHTWKLNGGSAISAVGKTATKNGYATHGGFTAKQKAVIERTVKSQVNKQIGGYQQAIIDINEVAQRATGLYNTTDEDAGITYYHNQPNIADSTYIYMESSAGRFMSTGANCWNNGNPVWTNAWSAMGQLVACSIAAGSITADMLSIGPAANAEERTSSVIVDKTGLSIYEGKIEIYNSDNKKIFGTDENGSLGVTGNIKVKFKNANGSDTATLKISNEDYQDTDYATASIKVENNTGTVFSNISMWEIDGVGTTSITSDNISLSNADGTVSINIGAAALGSTTSIGIIGDLILYNGDIELENNLYANGIITTSSNRFEGYRHIRYTGDMYGMLKPGVGYLSYTENVDYASNNLATTKKNIDGRTYDVVIMNEKKLIPLSKLRYTSGITKLFIEFTAGKYGWTKYYFAYTTEKDGPLISSEEYVLLNYWDESKNHDRVTISNISIPKGAVQWCVAVEPHTADPDFYAGWWNVIIKESRVKPTAALELLDDQETIMCRFDCFASDGEALVVLQGKAGSETSGRLELGTDKLYWGGGIVAERVEGSSEVSLKANIKPATSMLEKVCESGIYSYNYKSELRNESQNKLAPRYGLVIGDGYNTPEEVISSDGKHIDLYSMIALAWKAIQELADRIDTEVINDAE